MFNTIWKYPIDIIDAQVLEMPAGARILHLDIQNERPCIWVLVDEQKAKASYGVFVFGTGHQINHVSPNDYIGTCLLQNGRFVVHVFIQEGKPHA